MNLISLLAIAGLMHCPALLPTIDIAGRGPWPLLRAGLAIVASAAAHETEDQPSVALMTKLPCDEDDGDASEDPVANLLRTLEESASDLRTFTADIFYEVEDALLGPTDNVIRKGEIIYRVDAETRGRSFAILFDTRIVHRRKQERLRHYIYSDGWFVEVDHQEKLFIKRQVVAPGEEFDPLKLGQGPFPLPIGQEKDEVLARFNVSLIELPETGPLARLKGAVEVDGLRLVPKPDTSAAEDFERIDLFYDRKTHLPAGVNIIEVNGDRKTARLGDLKRNPNLDAEALGKLSIKEPDPTVWRIDIRPLKRE